MSADGSSEFTRRGILTILGAGALAARKASGATEEVLHFPGLDHVAINVSDVEKTISFYSKIFGNSVLKDSKTPRRYLKLGQAYIAIATPGRSDEIGRVDHICAGIEGYQSAKVKSYLQQRGIPVGDMAGGLMVTDPDGIKVQLQGSNGWAQLAKSNSPESVPIDGKPLFQPMGINHVMLHVTDVERAAGFYDKLFGPAGQRQPKRVTYQLGMSRVILSPVIPNEHPGVNHVCMVAEDFDYEAEIKSLTAMNVVFVKEEVAGAPEFEDRDRIIIQIQSATEAGKRALK